MQFPSSVFREKEAGSTAVLSAPSLLRSPLSWAILLVLLAAGGVLTFGAQWIGPSAPPSAESPRYASAPPQEPQALIEAQPAPGAGLPAEPAKETLSEPVPEAPKPPVQKEAVKEAAKEPAKPALKQAPAKPAAPAPVEEVPKPTPPVLLPAPTPASAPQPAVEPASAPASSVLG